MVIESKVVVKSRVGLHARPAAAFVQEALKHKCGITLEVDGKRANGKSVLEVLALGVKLGQALLVRADGEGEAEAMKNLVSLFSNHVGEGHEELR